MSKHYDLKLFAAPAHQALAQEMADILGVTLGQETAHKFPDGENYVHIEEPVRDEDIFFLQSCGGGTSSAANDSIMETLLFLDAFRRASVHSVTVIWPYFPYARQERMTKGREAISARVVADLLESQGISRLIYVDIHNPATQGFFKIPVDPLSAFKTIVNYLQQPAYQDCIVVSPDAGRADLATKYANALGLEVAIMYKRRINAEKTETLRIIGDVNGKRPIVVDDVMASGSVLKQIETLYCQGAVGKTVVAVTHPVLLPKAMELIKKDDRIGEVIVTNSIHLTPERFCEKITVLSIAPLLAEVIERIHIGKSISDLVP